MTVYLEVQRKAQAEIDSVIGKGRLPEFEDRESLPYVGALMKEILRLGVFPPYILVIDPDSVSILRAMIILAGSRSSVSVRLIAKRTRKDVPH